MRINIGCGMTPTIGWENFDNSFSLRLSRQPILASLLFKLKIINPPQMNYISFCRENDIQYSDATKHIPLPNDVVELLYSSHMLEHLDREEAKLFLNEARRVLKKGGTIRLAVPDIERKIEIYFQNRNADDFIESTHMCIPRPRTLSQRLRMVLVGTRHHQWMYDGKSLSKLLMENGFHNINVLAAGETTIPDPKPLDLCEREDESLYIEAVKG
jgi:predicted SAM-dependent methyltransferase